MFGFFYPIFEAVVAGYLVTFVVYAIGLFLVTRLGRKVLMDGDCVSTTYTVLLCATWLAAALAGAYVCCDRATPFPYGPILLPLVLAAVSASVVYRNQQQLSRQQSTFATAAITVMIVSGSVGAMYLHHAL